MPNMPAGRGKHAPAGVMPATPHNGEYHVSSFNSHREKLEFLLY